MRYTRFMVLLLPPHPVLIVRHRREKTAKCSLSPLKGREPFRFLRFPLLGETPVLEGYVRLGLGGPLVGPADSARGLLLLDASWHHVAAMEAVFAHVPVRSLPPLKTAFPRVSKQRQDPGQGLASIEALYAAFRLLGWPTEGLLDEYRWADAFLSANRDLLAGT